MVNAMQVAHARQWWEKLPDHKKGTLSIWTILAMYADHVASEGETPYVLDMKHTRE